MSDIRFEYPYIFLLIIIFLICSRYCKPRKEAIFFPHIEIFLKSKGANTPLLTLLKYLSIIFALIALASPIKEDRLQKETTLGYSIALVLDASGSMKLGFGENLFFAKKNGKNSKFKISLDLAKEFIKSRADDEIALLVFGNFAYVASPLTYDKKVLNEIMDKLYVGIAGGEYTVINDAIFSSAKLLSKSKAKTKIAILLTDGQSRGDNVPFEVAMKLINEYGVKVYTIGIGKDGDFDEKLLEKIAKESGGEFFKAYSKDGLKAIYQKINQLEKSNISKNLYIKKSYYYELPLFFSFISLLFYAFLLNKRGSL